MVAPSSHKLEPPGNPGRFTSGVPPTTALRWIGQMTEAGLLKRIEDETDRRRAFITLTDKAIEAMSAYFAELGNTAHRMV